MRERESESARERQTDRQTDRQRHREGEGLPLVIARHLFTRLALLHFFQLRAKVLYLHVVERLGGLHRIEACRKRSNAPREIRDALPARSAPEWPSPTCPRSAQDDTPPPATWMQTCSAQHATFQDDDDMLYFTYCMPRSPALSHVRRERPMCYTSPIETSV